LGVDHPAEIAGVVNVAGGAYYQGGGPSFFKVPYLLWVSFASVPTLQYGG